MPTDVLPDIDDFDTAYERTQATARIYSAAANEAAMRLAGGVRICDREPNATFDECRREPLPSGCVRLSECGHFLSAAW